MPLPWARLDTNIGQHDKILALIHDPSPKRWQAATSYMVSIAWSVGQETDGRIATYALGSVHGTPATARLLVIYRLWEEHAGYWQIVNFEKRQLTSEAAEAYHAKKSEAGQKGNCRRHHGDTCWRNGRCSRAAS